LLNPEDTSQHFPWCHGIHLLPTYSKALTWELSATIPV
jgi:hypothetical protein